MRGDVGGSVGVAAGTGGDGGCCGKLKGGGGVGSWSSHCFICICLAQILNIGVGRAGGGGWFRPFLRALAPSRENKPLPIPPAQATTTEPGLCEKQHKNSHAKPPSPQRRQSPQNAFHVLSLFRHHTTGTATRTETATTTPPNPGRKRPSSSSSL